MTHAALAFAENDQIGRVAGVDTSRVAIDVTNSEMLTRVGIGQLIAIKGATQAEFLIAMADRVTRTLREELPDPQSAEFGALTVSPSDHMQAFVIGTYRTVDGSKTDTFKRGADSFPQIDRDCFVIEGGNLQRFMGILGAGFSEEERLKLGTFVADRNAEAIASGDRFFQRHAAILGSTGSGKSWAVALLLERAAKLKFPNLIVFDMHGEYEPLADKAKGGFAQRIRIAGPGDLAVPNDDTLFLTLLGTRGRGRHPDVKTACVPPPEIVTPHPPASGGHLLPMGEGRAAPFWPYKQRLECWARQPSPSGRGWFAERTG